MASTNDADALIAGNSEGVINNITLSLQQKVDATDTSVNVLCKNISSTEKKLDDTEKLILDNVSSLEQLGDRLAWT